MPATAPTDERTILDFLPQLEKALGYTDTHRPLDVARSIYNGDAQLWQQGDGMVVTEIEDTPKKRILVFWLAAGDLGDCLALAEEAYEWGRSIGCDCARMLGRNGWAKPLSEHGWRVRHDLTAYEKDL